MTRAGARPLALGALGGVLVALAGPPLSVPLLALAGLVSLAAAVSSARTWRQALAAGLAFGVAFSLVALRFIPTTVQRFTPLGWVPAALCLVLLALSQALPWAAAMGAAHALVERARTAAPVAFAAGVLLAVSLPALFPWTPAGFLAPLPALLQLADAVGERGVVTLLALAAGVVASGLARRSWRGVLAGSLLVAAIGAHGALRMRALEAGDASRPRVTIALVDPSIDAKLRWDLPSWPAIAEGLRSVTRRAEASGVDLSIWPESAYPFVLAHAAGPTPRGPRGLLADEGPRGPVLAGLITDGGGLDRFNSATVVAPDFRMQMPADKQRLLWFGEVVPLADVFPWLRRTFQQGAGLVPATGPRLLTSGAARIAVLNCYEDTLPSVARSYAPLDPNLLVNLTNDAWFEGSLEPEMHHRFAVLRAIEQRRDLVRAVNRGVSSWIDASGRVRAQVAGDGAGFLRVRPALREGEPTLYARLGDAPFALGVALACAMARRRRPRPGS